MSNMGEYQTKESLGRITTTQKKKFFIKNLVTFTKEILKVACRVQVTYLKQ